MSFIALVSDSTAGFDAGYPEEHNVRIVPLYLRMDDKTYRDGVDITADEFYERLPHCDPLPTTSQPSVGDFAQVYRELADQGAKGIISVHLSSGISGTINSATLAAEQIEGIPIEIVDTLTASAPHMLAVEAGVRARDAGASFEETVVAIRRVVDNQKLVFAVDTLEYLYKGGRIGGAAALLGSLLQFKPLLHLVDGKIEALERVRTSAKALVRMADIVAGAFEAGEPLQAVLIQAACLERAEALAEHLPQHMNVANIRISIVPPVLGTHVGNGTVGLCCCPMSVLG